MLCIQETTLVEFLRQICCNRHDKPVNQCMVLEYLLTSLFFCLKGFLALEGELTPILVHLVRSDKNTTEMLDTSNDAAKILGK